MPRVSDSSLRALPATPVEQRIRVDANLYLRIRPTGKRTWAVRQMVAGKRSFVSLGDFPDVPLAAAKKKALELTGGGVDHGLTVALAVKVYRERHVSRLRPASQRSLGYYLDDLIAHHGTRKLVGLKRRDFVQVATSYSKRGKLPAANRCVTALHGFCAFAVDAGLIESNPLAGVRHQSVGGKETARTRVLSEDEIKWLWNDSPENHRRLWRALLLTACRVGELRVSTWGMVAGSTLVLPAGITKGNREHHLPLSKLAMQVIGERGKDDAPIFPMSGDSTVRAALARGGKTFTNHDIRRSAYTILSKLGVQPHVVERIVNHAPPKLVGVYNVYDYQDEMRAALEKLADWVGSVTAEV